MSIIINRHNILSHRFVAPYIGHNLYYTLIKENKLVDEHIVHIDYKQSNINFNLESFGVKINKKTNASIHINSGIFTIHYKLNDINSGISKVSEDNCSISNESNITTTYNLSNSSNVLKYMFEIKCIEYSDTIYNYQEAKPMQTIKITPLDIESAKNFKTFLSNMYKFVKTQLDNLSMNDEDLTIYCNDDSYWDELQSKSARHLDTVYLPIKIKNDIIKDLEWFHEYNTIQRYKILGRTHKRVYLFEGIPGSGKTTFISSLASKFGYDVAIINFTDKVTDGKLLRLIRTLPEKTFLVLEDIDCLFEERKKNDVNKNTVSFSGILNALDGIATPDNFICFMTTNYKCNLDGALLRPGRIDKIVTFEASKKCQIKDIYKSYMGEFYTEDYFKDFYNKFQELNIKAPVALIQEYLFKYLDNPNDSIENIDEMKNIYVSCYKNNAELYT